MGVEFPSLSEDFDTSMANSRLQLSMVLAFSEWWRKLDQGSLGRGPSEGAGQARARAKGRFPGRRPSLSERKREYIRVERSKGGEPAGTGQAPAGQSLDHPTGGQVESRVKIAASARSMASWQPDSVTPPRPCQRTAKRSGDGPRILAIPIRSGLPSTRMDGEQPRRGAFAIELTGQAG